MCGITGFTGPKDERLLFLLLEAIKHRGYDERAIFFENGVNLGLNRLSIIDLSKNLYPMFYGKMCLMLNGEIYNYKELKSKLQKRHIKFKTNCDAEVILPLYKLYGTRAFKMLEGMFAIAIFDLVKKEIVLARDKSGEKPLYYTFQNSQFYFCSELKGLLRISRITRKININSLHEYLRHGSLESGNTLIKDIFKLAPASYLIYNLRKKTVATDKYWRPEFLKTKYESNEKDLLVKLDSLISNSVVKRLLSDVPVGTFLSGGVDSSLITYFAREKKKNLKTFSIAFPEFNHSYNESRYSQLTSGYLNTNHTEVSCTLKTIIPIVENIGKYIDEPIVDPAFLPTKILAHEARKSVKVILSGDGGDELFGGYARYQKELIAGTLRGFIPNSESVYRMPWIRKISEDHSSVEKILTPLAKHYSPLNVWSDSEIQRLLNNNFSEKKSAKLDSYDRLAIQNPLLFMQLRDYSRYLPEQLLMKSDKACMLENLELRSPYLDTEIINFALSLPFSFKIRRSSTKYILRKVALKYLPKEIALRSKKGFDVPLSTWFRTGLKDYINESIVALKQFKNLVEVPYFENIVREHMTKRTNNTDKIWSVTVLAKWLDHYKISY